jgi:predicted amidohydrolase YtcJ
VRVAYSLFAQNAGAELADYRNLTQLLPMGFGDDMLRFNGIGERVTLAMYNNYAPDEATREKFYEVIRWAAGQGLAVTLHWSEGGSVPVLLDLYERLNREIPITRLRWSIAHLDDVSAESLARMKALGIGWTMQGDALLRRRPRPRHAWRRGQRMPPIMTAVRAGVVVGAGTDAHRVATYNPFIALQWMLDGKTVGGKPPAVRRNAVARARCVSHAEQRLVQLRRRQARRPRSRQARRLRRSSTRTISACRWSASGARSRLLLTVVKRQGGP